MNGRILISCCLLLLVSLGSAEARWRQEFEAVEAAKGIYAFIASESNSGAVQGNVVLIVGDTSSMLIDSGQYPSLAERMASMVEGFTDKPVRLLVNTHWHGDHLLANYIFKRRFPGILVVTHEETRRLADKTYEKWSEQVKGYPQFLEALKKAATTGINSKGVTLSEEQRESFQADAEALEAGIKDFMDSKYEPADMTFSKDIVFDLGNRRVRVSNLGRGNTAGDAVVFIPDAKVLITGDIVVYPTPYSFGSYHSEWIEVLKKMTALDTKIYIPGHGPVMRNADYLNTLIALLEDVRKQVRDAVNEKLTLEEVRKRVTLDDWKRRLAGENKGRQRAFREFFLNPGIERAYLEAKGEPLTE